MEIVRTDSMKHVELNSTHLSLYMRTHPSIPDYTFTLKHNNTTIFNKDFNFCDKDTECNSNEHYFSCPMDCPSGSEEGFCDGVHDGICDPDCNPSADPDCVTGQDDGVCDGALDGICDPDCPLWADVDCSCGDGKCDVPSETHGKCPEDCKLCLNDGYCKEDQYCYKKLSVCTEKKSDGRFCVSDNECLSGRCEYSECSPGYLPDLSILESDISFSITTPSEGDDISINATVHNIGNSNALNVSILFLDVWFFGYDILGNQMVDALNAGESRDIQVTWNAVQGIHYIYIVLDATKKIEELYENNNIAVKSLNVKPLDDTAPETSIELSGSAGANGWYLSNVVITLNATDDLSGVDYTEYSLDNIIWINYSTPFTISREGITTVYYRSTDNYGNMEEEKTAEVRIDQGMPEASLSVSPTGWTASDAVDYTPSCTDAISEILSCITEISYNSGGWTPINDIMEGIQTYLMTNDGTYDFRTTATDNANNTNTSEIQTTRRDATPPETSTGLTGEDTDLDGVYESTVNVTLNASDTGIGVQETHYKVDAGNYSPYIEPFNVTGTGYHIIRYYSVDGLGNAEAEKFLTVEIFLDEDQDGVADETDSCPLVFGRQEYWGCPVGDENLVELHVIDKAKTFCSGKGSCKVPVEGAEVRVFDRNDPEFQALYSKNPRGVEYPDVFESNVGKVGSCTTSNEGKCIAGEKETGDYLVIVKYLGGETGKTVYTGKPKGLEDFQDTDNDGIPDLAYKDFQIIKVINKDGSVDFKAGSKTIIEGSVLEVIYPQYVIWESNETLYPFIFTSDSNWTVDVCVHVPEGYEVINGGCSQVFVDGEVRDIIFTVVELGSPEPDVTVTLEAKHKGKKKKLDLKIKGRKSERYLKNQQHHEGGYESTIK